MNKVFSAGQTKQIATIVADALKASGVLPNITPTPTPSQPEDEAEVIADPGLEALFEAEAKLSLQMVSPVIKIVRGKRGTVMLNQTLDSLNAVRDMIKDRKTWRTSHKM